VSFQESGIVAAGGESMYSLLINGLVCLLLCIVLFFGPIVQVIIDFDRDEHIPDFASSVLPWRNLIFAPLTEEWVFRAQICSIMLSSGFSNSTTILVSPFFFSLGKQTGQRNK